MGVTVAIPSRGTGPQLRRSVIGAIRSASTVDADAEVLVVVNGRRNAPDLERIDSAALRVVFLDEANLARARNVGISEARYDTVLFGDDAAGFPVSWCAELAGALRDPRYPVVTAPVRVPVRGPVTAFLNYLRFFDAPPLDGVRARTVTGNCGLRRDRVPASVRFDEVRTPLVGEDVRFGHALRAAGVQIRWLADATPAEHLLAERIEELTDRFARYGRAAAGIWCRGDVPGATPADMYGFSRALASGRYAAYRRFREIVAPGTRAAFGAYDLMFDVSFLVGYLAGLGGRPDCPPATVDEDGLRCAWREIAAEAGARAQPWHESIVDLTRLDDTTPPGATTPTVDPLVARVIAAHNRHVRLPGAPTPTQPLARPEPPEPPATDRLRQAWHALRARGAHLTPGELNCRVREEGFTYREATATIERSATVRSATARPAAARSAAARG